MRERAKNPLPMKCCNWISKSRSDKMENKFGCNLYVDILEYFKFYRKHLASSGSAWFNQGVGLYFCSLAKESLDKPGCFAEGSATSRLVCRLNMTDR